MNAVGRHGEMPPPGQPWALQADLLDFSDEPGWLPPALSLNASVERDGIRWRPDHWLLVDGERIVGVQADAPPAGFARVQRRGMLLTPGLIDAHVHLPQLGVIASHGTDLLTWLERYTFPAEQAFADASLAREAAATFLDALLAHGTTAAMVMPTVHPESVDALFEAAAQRRMRIISGVCLMDRNAPQALLDAGADDERSMRAHLERWHGQGRARCAVTLRFAPTSTSEQMRRAARWLDERPDLDFQTHLAENQDEVAWVAKLFPQSRSYLDVYAHHGLLRAHGVYAHGIWLDDDDRDALARVGGVVAHCPSSNLFLGSGLMDIRALREAGVPVVLASDVGGGTHLSMLRTMADAYRVQAVVGHNLTAFQALHACTRGAARALRLDHEIGSLSPGRHADLCLWQWAASDVARIRDQLARTADDLHERLFAWMMLGDEHNRVTTWVAGRHVLA